MQDPALEETAGPHPLESHLSGPPEPLTLTALQTTENKPGRTREAEREDEKHIRKKNMEELIINFFPFSFFFFYIM